MTPKFIGLSITAVILSFIGGFLLANSLNRAELDKLRKTGQPAASPASQTEKEGDQTALTDEEIQARLNEADNNPSDIAFQKNLGLALFRYAGMRQDGKLLLEVTRLLERVYKDQPSDYDIIVALGHSYFDAGLLTQNNEVFLRSRPFYEAALKLRSDDVEIRTDLGLTYVLAEPADFEKGLVELDRANKLDPNNLKTLSALAQAYAGTKDFEKAESTIAQIEAKDPQYIQLPELKKRLSGARQSNP